jgi:hypothetical protein
MEEIITLQLGCYSNFIGAHYWNIQQEQLDRNRKTEGKIELNVEDVFHSSTVADLLQPRTLIFDSKDNWGSLLPQTIGERDDSSLILFV